jgi:triacylglycerol lipase
MTPLGLVQTGTTTAAAPETAALAVQFEETLASGRRIWLRGRIVEPSLSVLQPRVPGRWWKVWPRDSASALPRPTVQLETRISGHDFKADVPLQPDGRFEAQFQADLPLARRGWRIARNRVACHGLTGEKCSVVLMPPASTTAILLVVLPMSCTTDAAHLQRLANSDTAARMGPILRRFQQATGDSSAVYYLARVTPDAGLRQSELAVALANLGWPSGHHVLVPVDSDTAATALGQAVDRLRWLFAGVTDLELVNLDPDLSADILAKHSSDADRAAVHDAGHPSKNGAETLRPVSPMLTLLRPTRTQLIPRHPVVFCHGMLAFTRLRMQLPEDLNCFSPLRQFLRDRGFRVLFPQVAPTAGVKERAQQLCEQIRNWTDEPVNLVAHSMGGLDARYLTTHLGMVERVCSLTTVSTPHRGTYLADWFLGNFRQRVPLLLAMEALGVNVDGFRDCRPCSCVDFNTCTPDVTGVRYFSYVGSVAVAHVSPVLRRAWNLLSAVEGPNDGMVSVASAHWGEYLGVVHADHFAQTPDRVFVRPGEDFDALSFYIRLLHDLARRGL